MNNNDNDILQETIALAQQLVRAESISPCDGGLHKMIAEYFSALGFSVENIDIENTKNLYARIGNGPYMCFAGHTDVVPPGTGWKHGSPYSAIIEDGCLYGRGTNDMKTTIACAMTTFKYLLRENPNLSLAILLTSDEEAIAEHGLKQVVPLLIERAESIKLFILGEPTAREHAGDTVKIGRRGSITAIAKIFGIQGHIAYPELAKNPIPTAIKIAQELADLDFNDEHEHFGKSRLQLTQIDAFNKTMNLIPSTCELRFGVRFNTHQTETSIKEQILPIFRKHCEDGSYEIAWSFNGYPFICEDEKLLAWLANIINPIIEPIMGQNVIFDAKGATSDGRFLCKLAECIEIGFQEDMAHKVDERVKINEIATILQIYRAIFASTF